MRNKYLTVWQKQCRRDYLVGACIRLGIAVGMLILGILSLELYGG